MKIPIIVLLFILLLSACRQQDKSKVKNPDEVTFYNVLLEKALDDAAKGIYQTVSLSEVGKNISYITLEVNANSMFKRIMSITLYDSSIYISDMYKVLEFTRSGKFVRQIGQRGKGPGEYIYAYEMVACDTLRYLRVDRHRFFLYTPDGTYIKSVVDLSKFEPQQMILMNDKFVFGCFNSPEIRSSNPYNLIITDQHFNVIKTFLNHHKRKTAGLEPGSDYPPLYTFHGEARYKDCVADTLFTVTVDSLIPYARFDLGKHRFPHDVIFRSEAHADEIMAQNKDKIVTMRLFEDVRNFYMRLGSLGKPTIFGLYSKQTGETKILGESGFQNDLDGGLPFFPRYVYNDSILVDWVDAYDLREKVLNADATAMHKQYGQKFDALLKLAKSLNDDSGTVLIMVKP